MALTQCVESVLRETKGETHKYLVRRCPRGDNFKDGIGSHIEFRDKTGYTNPYTHLRNCVFHTDEEALINSYLEIVIHILRLINCILGNVGIL